MLPMTWPLLKMIWTIDRHMMPKLRSLVDGHRGQKKVFHIHTLNELRAFHSEAERHAKTA